MQEREIEVRHVQAGPEGVGVARHQIHRDRVAGAGADVIILLAVLLRGDGDAPAIDGLGCGAGEIRAAVRVEAHQLVPRGGVAVQRPRVVVPEPRHAEPMTDLVLQDLDRADLVRGQGGGMGRIGIDEEELVDVGRVDGDQDVRRSTVHIHARQQLVLGPAAIDARSPVLPDIDRGGGAAVGRADRCPVGDGDLDVDRAQAVEVLGPLGHGRRGVGQEGRVVAMTGRIDQRHGAFEGHRRTRRSKSQNLLAQARKGARRSQNKRQLLPVS